MAQLIKTQAIALLQRKYSESSIIVQMYTAEHGRQAFIVPGARKHKARIKSNFFTPLSLVDIEQYRNEKGGLQKLKEATLSVPLSEIRFDIIKSSIALYLAEFLLHVLKEEERNLNLFDFLANAIHLLENQEQGVANFHLVFLLELTHFIGFYPHTNYAKERPFFDVQNGLFTTMSNAQTLPLHTSQLMANLLRTNFRSLQDLHLNHQQRSNLLDAVTKFYNWHVAGMKEIQSLDVLSALFS